MKTLIQQDLSTDVHKSSAYNSQDMEATHVSINTLLDKEDIEYIYLTLYIYACVHIFSSFKASFFDCYIT